MYIYRLFLICFLLCNLELIYARDIYISKITLAKANAIRESLVPLIPLSHTKLHCIDINNDTLQQVFKRFARDEGGVWCAGAAHILTQVYNSKGIPAFTLSYGFFKEGLLTHAVTVVNTKEGWFIQDPYFNLYFLDPFPEVIFQLSRGYLPDFKVSVGFRKIHFNNTYEIINSNKYTKNPNSTIVKIDDSHFYDELALDVHKFNRYYSDRSETMQLLSQRGMPEDSCFLMLYPYGISDHTGYHPVNNYQYIFDRYKIRH